MKTTLLTLLLSLLFIFTSCSGSNDDTPDDKKEENCKTTEHKDGNLCINNTKMVSCIENTPENAESIKKDVEINWKDGKWEEAAVCEWNCKADYEEKSDLCVLKDKCEHVKFENIILDGFDNGASVYTDVTGDYELLLEFYESTPPADYNLNSEGVNDNYKTCEQCVLVSLNNKKFYPISGILKVLNGNALEGLSKGEFSAELTEVTVDENNDYKSTVVENGDCLKIDLSLWDTEDTILCENNETRCNNDKVERCVAHSWKVINDCSEFSGTCDEDKKECITANNCIGLSFETITVNTEFGTTYESVNGDYEIGFEFYESTPPGQYDLSSSANDNYINCNQCVLIKNNAKRYFQDSGTIKVISGDAYTTKSKVEVTSLKLVEVTLDDSMESTIVNNGECIEVQTVLWDSL